MPDSKDYSKYLPDSSRFSLDDMGELAVRLGSPVTYDRRGEVVYFDTFNNGITHYEFANPLNGASYKLSNINGYRWPYHITMLGGTTLDNSMYFGFQMAMFSSKKVGFEVLVCNIDEFKEFKIGISGFAFGAAFGTEIKIEGGSGNIYARTGAATYTLIGNGANGLFSNNKFVSMKFVIDLEEHKYVRFMYAAVELDISTVSFSFTPASNPDNISTIVQIVSDGVTNPTCKVAQIIITGNEP